MTILIVIIVSNFTIPSALISFLIGESGFKKTGCLYIIGSGKFNTKNHRTLKEDNSFRYDNGYKITIEHLKEYRLKNPDDTTALYRRFPINPLKFWRWREYLTCDCYELPYMSDRKAERLIEQVKQKEWEEYQERKREGEERNHEK